VPREVSKLIQLSESELFFDSDSLARVLFGFHDQVEAVVETAVARVVIDLNRHPDDRPPANPDGVIKFLTKAGVPVYHKNRAPDEPLVESLLNKYYHPYHQTLDKLSEKPGVRIVMDCHCMLPHSPANVKSPTRKRPAICLSNCGNNRGEAADGNTVLTCPADVMQQLAECFAEAFELPEEAVLMNEPYKGGHIIQSHYTGRIPWVQVAINRNLYLQTNKRKRGSTQFSQLKVDRVKANIWTALNLFFLNFNGYYP